MYTSQNLLKWGVLNFGAQKFGLGPGRHYPKSLPWPTQNRIKILNLIRVQSMFPCVAFSEGRKSVNTRGDKSTQGVNTSKCGAFVSTKEHGMYHLTRSFERFRIYYFVFYLWGRQGSPI